MKNISFISQDISLFNESIKQNIILDENIVDEEAIISNFTKRKDSVIKSCKS